MINNFSNKYGKPKDTIFVIGDYDTGSYNMKGVELGPDGLAFF